MADDNVEKFTDESDEVSEAVERWKDSVEVSKACGQKARSDVPEGGEKRFERYLECRINPDEAGVV